MLISLIEVFRVYPLDFSLTSDSPVCFPVEASEYSKKLEYRLGACFFKSSSTCRVTLQRIDSSPATAFAHGAAWLRCREHDAGWRLSSRHGATSGRLSVLSVSYL